MTRLHVTIYNEISLDGRIEGFDSDLGRCYRLSFGGAAAGAAGTVGSTRVQR
jgi:hypothetical protein